MLDTSQLNKFKSILFRQIDKLPNNVALCLSAGYDSVALLALLLDAGKSVTIYSFTLDNMDSYDYTVAKNLAAITDSTFVGIKLPTNENQLKSDILLLHEKYGCVKKTDYECVWPFIYVYSQIKESIIVTGLGAEGHFGSTKKGSIHYKDNLDEFRNMFFSNPNVSQIIQHKKLCNQYNMDFWFPFLTDEVRKFFIGKTWADVNKPKVKQPIIDLIPSNFMSVKLKSGNLQIASNVTKHFDSLIYTDWNIGNYKSIVGILNCVNRGYFNHVQRLI